MTSLKLQTKLTRSSTIGNIKLRAADDSQDSYLLCDGSAVSRTTYSALFAIIGETYGEGDNSTTFNLPDLRGRFARGVDGGIGNDPDAGSRTALHTGGNTGDNIGSYQDHEHEGHKHELQLSSSTPPSGDWIRFASNAGTTGQSRGPFQDEGTSTETRPINVNVNYYIRYEE